LVFASRRIAVKVALVTEFYYPHLGGVTEHVYHLARYLTARGHGVRVVTNHVAEAPRRADLETVMVPEGAFDVIRIGRGMPIESNGSQSRVTIGFGLERRMRAALEGVDLVHVQSPLFPMLPYLALKVARRRGVPTVGTFHTNFDGSAALRAFGPVIRSYSRAIDRGIAVSESAGRAVADFLAAPPIIIPNGVDVAAWSAGERRPELCQGQGHGPGTTGETGARNIVFLGRLDPRNDVEVLLAAFARIAPQAPDARLILVGDGPRRAEYEASVPPALAGRVVFAGSQTSVEARASYLASAEVMAFTARIVSHPMALIEGMAAGRAVVAYDIEGVRELVTDGREGYKVPVGDVDALGDALVAVLCDDAHRRVMARLARARAASFDWSVVAQRIEAVYYDLIGDRPRVEPRAHDASLVSRSLREVL
jgi:phosphatidylinositol alpha-mannosyltransferase